MVTPEAPTSEAEAEAPATRSTLGNILRALGYLIIALALAALGYLLYSRYVEKRRAEEGEQEPGLAGAYGRVMEDIAVEGETTPALRTTSATYREGDDFFNPSFSIEDGAEFLGECGVGYLTPHWRRRSQKGNGFGDLALRQERIKTVTTVLSPANMCLPGSHVRG